MGGGCTGAPAEGGRCLFVSRIAAGDTEKEGDGGSGSASRRRAGGTHSVSLAGGLGGSKVEEPDAASRRLPPPPEGLMAKGPHAVSAGLARTCGPRSCAPAIGCADAALSASRMVNGEPAPPYARLRAWRPFAINAAPIDYLDGLLENGNPSLSHPSPSSWPISLSLLKPG